VNSPETHSAIAEAAQQTCEQCGGLFTPTRGWARFCKTKCRNDFHGKLARIEAIRARALVMYEALRQIADEPARPYGTTARRGDQGPQGAVSRLLTLLETAERLGLASNPRAVYSLPIPRSALSPRRTQVGRGGRRSLQNPMPVYLDKEKALALHLQPCHWRRAAPGYKAPSGGMGSSQSRGVRPSRNGAPLRACNWSRAPRAADRAGGRALPRPPDSEAARRQAASPRSSPTSPATSRAGRCRSWRT
jgi:hypothetical protein